MLGNKKKTLKKTNKQDKGRLVHKQIIHALRITEELF